MYMRYPPTNTSFSFFLGFVVFYAHCFWFVLGSKFEVKAGATHTYIYIYLLISTYFYLLLFMVHIPVWDETVLSKVHNAPMGHGGKRKIIEKYQQTF